MNAQDDVTQDELHAYVDGLLDPDDVERMEAWLAAHPEDAATVHAYRLQNTKLRQTFKSTQDDDIPDDMLQVVMGKKAKTSPVTIPWMRLAASVALLLFGGMGGWLLHGQQNERAEYNSTAFVNQAVGAHRVFVSEVRHPVEVPASQEEHLVAWLSKRIGTRLKVPSLQDQGFQLVGGRLLADHALPAAQFMYEDDNGKRLTLYVRASNEEDAAFRFVSNNGDTAFYWIDEKFAYALIAPLKRSELTPVANKVYQQLTAP